MRTAAEETLDALSASIARLKQLLQAEDCRRGPFPATVLARLIVDADAAAGLLGRHADVLRSLLTDPTAEPTGRGKRCL
jgi:hypothetical protein